MGRETLASLETETRARGEETLDGSLPGPCAALARRAHHVAAPRQQAAFLLSGHICIFFLFGRTLCTRIWYYFAVFPSKGPHGHHHHLARLASHRLS